MIGFHEVSAFPLRVERSGILVRNGLAIVEMMNRLNCRRPDSRRTASDPHSRRPISVTQPPLLPYRASARLGSNVLEGRERRYRNSWVLRYIPAFRLARQL